jgi:hypothetical protein
MSSNFGDRLSMAVASFFLPFLPLLATQILLNNLLYDLSDVTRCCQAHGRVAMPERRAQKPQALD